MNIDAPAAALHELERNMRINEDILRHMSIRVDELDPEPSVMMQSRGARDDRGGRPSRGGYGGGDQPAKTSTDDAADKEKVKADAETAPEGDEA